MAGKAPHFTQLETCQTEPGLFSLSSLPSPKTTREWETGSFQILRIKWRNPQTFAHAVPSLAMLFLTYLEESHPLSYLVCLLSDGFCSVKPFPTALFKIETPSHHRPSPPSRPSLFHFSYCLSPADIPDFTCVGLCLLSFTLDCSQR